MVRDLLSVRPEKLARPKVLLLGISYPDVAGQMEKHGFDQDVLTNKEPSVDQAVECVRRNILTEMDARDLARCVATEDIGQVDVYTFSKEIGAVYRDDRHVYGDFNARGFGNTIKEAFGKDVQFSQIILDYYWMPTGWLVTRWSKTLFQRTLPDLVRCNLLTYPSKRKRRNREGLEEGVVYLPFCAHVCKELVGAIGILEKYFAISFVKKSELGMHSLWKGTMNIDGDLMQTRLGKRLDQEEIYCTFRPRDIFESMEDSHVSKDAVMRVLMSIEDYDNIRMIRLRPLRQHEPPSVMKERLIRPEVGGFKGLNPNLIMLREAEEKRKKDEEKQRKAAEIKKLRAEEKKRIELAKAEARRKKEEARKLKADERKRKSLEKKKQQLEARSTSSNKSIQKDGKTVDARTAPAKAIVVDLDENDHGVDNAGTAIEPDVSSVDSDDDDDDYDDYDDDYDGNSGDDIDYDKLPSVTFFYPGPAIDFAAYNLPEMGAIAKAAPKTSKSRRRSTKTAEAAQKAAQTNIEESTPRTYLSYNPRRPMNGMATKYPTPQHETDSDKKSEKTTFDKDSLHKSIMSRDVETEGACNLFDLRHADLKACYRIPKEAIVKRLQSSANSKPQAFGTEGSDAEKDYDTLSSAPTFEAAVQACRGDFDKLLEDEDVQQLEKLRVRLGKGPSSSKGRRNSKSSRVVVDRVFHLDIIQKWLFFNKDPSFDPTGELADVDSKLAPDPEEKFWERVKRIEHDLLISTKKTAADAPFGSRWTKRVDLRNNIVKWLLDRCDENDPGGEFAKAESSLPNVVTNRPHDRAEMILKRIDILRHLDRSLHCLADTAIVKQSNSVPKTAPAPTTPPVPVTLAESTEVVARADESSLLHRFVDIAISEEPRSESVAAVTDSEGGDTANDAKRDTDVQKLPTSVETKPMPPNGSVEAVVGTVTTTATTTDPKICLFSRQRDVHDGDDANESGEPQEVAEQHGGKSVSSGSKGSAMVQSKKKPNEGKEDVEATIDQDVAETATPNNETVVKQKVSTEASDKAELIDLVNDQVRTQELESAAQIPETTSDASSELGIVSESTTPPPPPPPVIHTGELSTLGMLVDSAKSEELLLSTSSASGNSSTNTAEDDAAIKDVTTTDDDDDDGTVKEKPSVLDDTNNTTGVPNQTDKPGAFLSTEIEQKTEQQQVQEQQEKLVVEQKLDDSTSSGTDTPDGANPLSHKNNQSETSSLELIREAASTSTSTSDTSSGPVSYSTLALHLRRGGDCIEEKKTTGQPNDQNGVERTKKRKLNRKRSSSSKKSKRCVIRPAIGKNNHQGRTSSTKTPASAQPICNDDEIDQSQTTHGLESTQKVASTSVSTSDTSSYPVSYSELTLRLMRAVDAIANRTVMSKEPGSVSGAGSTGTPLNDDDDVTDAGAETKIQRKKPSLASSSASLSLSSSDQTSVISPIQTMRVETSPVSKTEPKINPSNDDDDDKEAFSDKNIQANKTEKHETISQQQQEEDIEIEVINRRQEENKDSSSSQQMNNNPLLDNDEDHCENAPKNKPTVESNEPDGTAQKSDLEDLTISNVPSGSSSTGNPTDTEPIDFDVDQCKASLLDSVRKSELGLDTFPSPGMTPELPFNFANTAHIFSFDDLTDVATPSEPPTREAGRSSLSCQENAETEIEIQQSPLLNDTELDLLPNPTHVADFGPASVTGSELDMFAQQCGEKEGDVEDDELDEVEDLAEEKVYDEQQQDKMDDSKRNENYTDKNTPPGKVTDLSESSQSVPPIDDDICTVNPLENEIPVDESRHTPDVTMNVSKDNALKNTETINKDMQKYRSCVVGREQDEEGEGEDDGTKQKEDSDKRNDQIIPSLPNEENHYKNLSAESREVQSEASPETQSEETSQLQEIIEPTINREVGFQDTRNDLGLRSEMLIKSGMDTGVNSDSHDKVIQTDGLPQPIGFIVRDSEAPVFNPTPKAKFTSDSYSSQSKVVETHQSDSPTVEGPAIYATSDESHHESGMTMTQNATEPTGQDAAHEEGERNETPNAEETTRSVETLRIVNASDGSSSAATPTDGLDVSLRQSSLLDSARSAEVESVTSPAVESKSEPISTDIQTGELATLDDLGCTTTRHKRPSSRKRSAVRPRDHATTIIMELGLQNELLSNGTGVASAEDQTAKSFLGSLEGDGIASQTPSHNNGSGERKGRDSTFKLPRNALLQGKEVAEQNDGSQVFGKVAAFDLGEREKPVATLPKLDKEKNNIEQRDRGVVKKQKDKKKSSKRKKATKDDCNSESKKKSRKSVGNVSTRSEHDMLPQTSTSPVVDSFHSDAYQTPTANSDSARRLVVTSDRSSATAVAAELPRTSPHKHRTSTFDSLVGVTPPGVVTRDTFGTDTVARTWNGDQKGSSSDSQIKEGSPMADVLNQQETRANLQDNFDRSCDRGNDTHTAGEVVASSEQEPKVTPATESEKSKDSKRARRDTEQPDQSVGKKRKEKKERKAPKPKKSKKGDRKSESRRSRKRAGDPGTRSGLDTLSDTDTSRGRGSLRSNAYETPPPNVDARRRPAVTSDEFSVPGVPRELRRASPRGYRTSTFDSLAGVTPRGVFERDPYASNMFARAWNGDRRGFDVDDQMRGGTGMANVANRQEARMGRRDNFDRPFYWGNDSRFPEHGASHLRFEPDRPPPTPSRRARMRTEHYEHDDIRQAREGKKAATPNMTEKVPGEIVSQFLEVYKKVFGQARALAVLDIYNWLCNKATGRDEEIAILRQLIPVNPQMSLLDQCFEFEVLRHMLREKLPPYCSLNFREIPRGNADNVRNASAALRALGPGMSLQLIQYQNQVAEKIRQLTRLQSAAGLAAANRRFSGGVPRRVEPHPPNHLPRNNGLNGNHNHNYNHNNNWGRRGGSGGGGGGGGGGGHQGSINNAHRRTSDHHPHSRPSRNRKWR